MLWTPNCTLVELKCRTCGTDEALTCSKLYLSGIEMQEHINRGPWHYTPNCTLVELKCRICGRPRDLKGPPNCTLVELKSRRDC